MATEINKLVVPISDGQGGYTPTEITFESGTGGHTIENESGTSMTARSGLQFKGADVSDDSTNNRTVVDMSYTEIDYEDWLELTEQEKETGRWDVVGVPGADGTVSFELMTKLWENPDPTVTFAAQNITLSSDDYDMLLWIYQSSTSYANQKSSICKKGNSVILDMASYSQSGANTSRRSADIISSTKYYVGDCYLSIGTTAGTSDNSRNIPVSVYGIKTKQTVEIKAIAPEVSTSASKCMMSDGETSVEEALSYSTDEHIVGKWIDGKPLYEKTIDFGNLPNTSTTKQVAHGLTNFVIRDLKGIAVDSNSNTTFPLPYVGGGTSFDSYINIYVDSTKINIRPFTNRSEFYAYVTLRYTKITD